MSTLIERLKHAKATASNDDYSKAGTRERARHLERLETIDAAIAALEAVSPAPGEPVAKPLVFLDEAGNTFVANGEALLAAMAAIPKPEIGRKLLPLYASPPTSPPEPPKGWKLVPEEPTDAMLSRGACYEDPDDRYKDDVDLGIRSEGDIASDVYRAMLASSPSPGSAE